MKIELAQERLRKIGSKRASARAYKIHLEYEALCKKCLECGRLDCTDWDIARMTKEKLQKEKSDDAGG